MTHVARSSQLRRLPLPYLRPLRGPESTVTLVRSDSSHSTHTFPVFLNIVGDPRRRALSRGPFGQGRIAIPQPECALSAGRRRLVSE